jgi:phenylpyruvate tautomerase PptA (4-oxalocrotonate tautomerase family)
MRRPENVPLIQIDVQPLSPEQRAELRSRVVAAVSQAIGSPCPYVSVIIRESQPSNLVEAGGWGPYDRREPLPAGHSLGAAAGDGDRSAGRGRP